ncbi:Crp/Fnr family transcriptional regulator [Stutzerimonas urumqiensis]|uniref:Crp/Fnr family transcriptional regulator n=1 Tax=Stutzerimonas urumqiensis TaxID=638269 RepID=UPI003DA3BF4B
MKHDALRKALGAGLWFSQLAPDLQAVLLEIGELRSLAAGDVLFRRGDKPCGLYAVLKGAVRIGAVNRQGREAMLLRIEPPFWFGEIAVFDGQPRTHDATADVATQLLHLPHAALLARIDAQPRLWHALGLLMSQKLRMTFGALEEISLLPSSARLARRLAIIAAGYGETEGVRHRIRLSQEQLAQMLGLSRQTTNQLLKELEAQGTIRLAYGQIDILDLATLRRLGRG